MRSLRLGHAILVLLLSSAPASAATIIALSITDTNIYDTSTILFYDFTADDQGGGTLTFVRELDHLSDDFQLAVVNGTQFSGATLVEDAGDRFASHRAVSLCACWKRDLFFGQSRRSSSECVGADRADCRHGDPDGRSRHARTRTCLGTPSREWRHRVGGKSSFITAADGESRTEYPRVSG